MFKLKKMAGTTFLGLLIVGTIFAPLFAGDSLYGKVREVKSADLVTFDYGTGTYQVRIIGIEVPQDARIAKDASNFVSSLLLGKNVRMRFEGRTPNGEMLGRLFTDDPVIGIKEVTVELIKAGLVRRQKDFDFKYGELSKAENEAREAKRGLWAPTEPK